MPLTALAQAIDRREFDLLSSDLFDTVLLRDHTTETVRLATAARRAARLLDADPATVTALRWAVHGLAYRAVAMERPEGEARLEAISATVARALGRDEAAARVLHRTEVDVDIEHLRPHRALVGLLHRAAAHGVRVIAVSDTWYSGADLERMLAAVVGDHPFGAVHSSADAGVTKHAGGLYPEVARREGVAPDRILHVGDNAAVDVAAARAAGWSAIHVPRHRAHRGARLVGRVGALRAAARRAR